MRHNRPAWPFTRWSRHARQKRAAAVAAAHQEAEYRAAVGRILTEPVDWLHVVRGTPPRRAPLLTRGQAARSEQHGRRRR